MLKNFLIALSFMGLFACGHNVTEKSSSSIEREQPALTVYFPPLLAWLSPQERQKLWTFRDMDESTGYWVIVGHSDKNGSDEFKEQISVARARAVEKYLRDTYDYDVVGIIQGLSDKKLVSKDQALNRRAEVMFVKYE